MILPSFLNNPVEVTNTNVAKQETCIDITLILQEICLETKSYIKLTCVGGFHQISCKLHVLIMAHTISY